jgi:hypothetical protein
VVAGAGAAHQRAVWSGGAGRISGRCRAPYLLLTVSHRYQCSLPCTRPPPCRRRLTCRKSCSCAVRNALLVFDAHCSRGCGAGTREATAKPDGELPTHLLKAPSLSRPTELLVRAHTRGLVLSAARHTQSAVHCAVGAAVVPRGCAPGDRPRARTLAAPRGRGRHTACVCGDSAARRYRSRLKRSAARTHVPLSVREAVASVERTGFCSHPTLQDFLPAAPQYSQARRASAGGSRLAAYACTALSRVVRRRGVRRRRRAVGTHTRWSPCRHPSADRCAKPPGSWC